MSTQPNITLRGLLPQPELPCYACQKALPIQTTKVGKPYLTCNECGIQIFIRGKAGIARIEKLKEFWSKEIKPSLEICLLINQLKQLREQREQLNPGLTEILGENEKLAHDRKILDKQIELIEEKIKKAEIRGAL